MGNGRENGCGIRLIAGLGNPGAEYAGSRHNAGFETVSRLLEKMPKSMTCRHLCQSEVWHGSCAGRALFLQKPLTYMNLSGEAVVPLMRSEKIMPEELAVIHDDMDVPLGRIRIRCGGGDAGHNGLKSIISLLGTENFVRIRIGVGHPAARKDVVDFVLSRYTEAEQEIMSKVFEGAAEAVILMLRRGIATAMNQYNSRSWVPEEESCKTEKPTILQQQQINQHPEVQI